MSALPFNEDSRVKIPALLHLSRLGYTCLSLKGRRCDPRNNIFVDVFEAAVLRLNPELRREAVPALLDEIQLKLAGEDLGRGFHQHLTARSGVRLLDLDALET
jgi:type I restriction enzyme R subunit